MPNPNPEHYTIGSDLPGSYPHTDGYRRHELYLEPGSLPEYNQRKCRCSFSFHHDHIYRAGNRIRHLHGKRFYDGERNAKPYDSGEPVSGKYLPGGLNGFNGIRRNIL